VPYGAVDAVYSGQRLPEPLRLRSIAWPGYYVGRARARNLGVLQVFATTREPNDLTILLTDLGGYALSGGETFRAALVERLEAAGRAPEGVWSVTRGSQGWGSTPRPLSRAWTDPWLPAATSISLVLLLAMVGYILDRYESLPELLALRLDASGQPEYIRPRFDLFHLPAIGALVLVGDVLLGSWIHRWEPLAGRLVWAAPVLVQCILAIAVLRSVG
jgi:hypothetical protein